jgi:hypothetical protein
MVVKMVVKNRRSQLHGSRRPAAAVPLAERGVGEGVLAALRGPTSSPPADRVWTGDRSAVAPVIRPIEAVPDD